MKLLLILPLLSFTVVVALSPSSSVALPPDCNNSISQGGRYQALVCWLWSSQIHLPNEQFKENVFTINNVQIKGTVDLNFSREKYLNKAFGHHELYDMVEDPKENNNLGENPAYQNVCAEMKKLIDENLARYRVENVKVVE